jgi:hypothetical protein
MGIAQTMNLGATQLGCPIDPAGLERHEMLLELLRARRGHNAVHSQVLNHLPVVIEGMCNAERSKR